MAPSPPRATQAPGTPLERPRLSIGRSRVAYIGPGLDLAPHRNATATVAIAVDALGAERVRAVMLPSPYTAEISWLDSRAMVARLGVRYDEIPIAPCFDAFKSTLATEFAGRPEDTTEENLQARIRGTTVMVATHDAGLMQRFPYRTLRFRAGRLEAS